MPNGEELKQWDGKERRINYGLDASTIVKITEMHGDLHHLVEDFKNHKQADRQDFDKLGSAVETIKKIVWMGIGAILLIQFVLPLVKK